MKRGARAFVTVSFARAWGRASVLLFVLANVLLMPRAAFAHTMGLSTGLYEARGARVDVEIAVARAELLSVCVGLDADHDMQVSPAELARAPDCLSLSTALLVTADGARCEPQPVDASLTEADGALFHVSFACPGVPVRVAVDDAWLTKLPASHKHVARAKGRAETDMVLDHTRTRFEIEPAEAPAPTPTSDAREERTRDEGARPNLFRLGVAHILGTGGLDHLAFLAGLVLAPGLVSRAKLRALLVAVTAFSVGHTLSLALSVSGAWVPSPRLVEPLIALSIAWVAAENALRESPSRRAWITLPFGMVHGFGFAASLREIMGAHVGLSLFTFNVGVEAGQVLAVVPMLALVIALERRGLLGRRARLALNVTLCLGGVALAIARLARPS